MTDQERIEALEAKIEALTDELSKTAPAPEPAENNTPPPSGVNKDLGAALRDEIVTLTANQRQLAADLARLAARQGHKDIAASAKVLADA